jgi:aminoglycoside phosphotransferase family enzyme/predicted kinase
VVETSAAWVFLYPHRALKVKRPVDFGFLDFTSLDKREWALKRELSFNKETAPELYRSVHRITHVGHDKETVFALDGAGETVEWVLEMARFEDDSVLAENPGAIEPGFAEKLGREIARFHAAARRVSPRAGVEGLAYVLGSNASLLRRLKGELDSGAVERLIETTQAEFDRHADLLVRRGEQGWVRRCHGDLHLGNIVVHHGRPLLFDCIEFNDTLSEIDVLYDLAFTLMDLRFKGLRQAANRAMNGWLDEAARQAEEPFEGLSLLPLFQAVRAAVRVHVSAWGGDILLARRYLAEAQEHLEPRAPVLAAVGGLSGSGKSSLSRALAPRLGRAPGAVVLRSDEVRKRLWNAGPLEALPKAAYAPGQSQRVYGAMIEAGRQALKAGRAVILDAVFLRREERDAAAALGAEMGVPFHGAWLELAPEVMRARVVARTGDASDADEKVLEAQLLQDPGLMEWKTVSGADPSAGAAVEVARWFEE